MIRLSSCVGALLLVAPALAWSNPRPLPFTYGAQLQPPGALEIEQYVDIVPMRVQREDDVTGLADAVTAHRYVIQTEFEYGITDWLEASFYLVWRQGASAGTPALRFQGVKQRVRIRPPLGDTLPFEMALYLEVAEMYDEIELEQKLILARTFGRLRLAINLWIEEEWYLQVDETKIIFNPTAGATFDISPHVVVGLEYWLRGRLDSGGTHTGEVPSSTHHYLGPTLMLQAEPVWLTAGAYLRMEDLGDPVPLDDPYGRVWVRILFGIGLTSGHSPSPQLPPAGPGGEGVGG
jgi:hypothetical protein